MPPMRSGLMLGLSILVLCAPLTSDARGEVASSKPHQYADLLRKQCDALVASALKRPYGWGWADASDGDAKLAAQKIPVSLEPGATPAAGLLLLYSSELLQEPAYADAARQVARGVSAGQRANGKFPSQALFARTNVLSIEQASALPDRGSTRASLALLLSLIDDTNKEKQQEEIARAASRGTRWLVKQQADPGGWPVTFPPGAPPTRATRLIRLDTPDTRDSILTMLLGYEVMGDPFHRRSVEKSLEFLVKVRSGAGLPVGAGLWESACTLSGLAHEKSPDFPEGYDTLASRNCMQAFLGAWVILGDGQRLIAADLAGRSIQDLIKNEDGGAWHRHYSSKGATLDPRVNDEHRPVFGTGAAEAPKSDPLLAPTLEAIEKAKALGREKYRERLRTRAPLKHFLAQVTVGLTSEVMPADFPATAAEVAPYLKRHEALFGSMNGTEGDLRERVKRTWAIYLRARIERELGI